jgi:hypothetical protein
MKKTVFTLVLSLMAIVGFSQCDSLAGQCEKHINENYISDGQAYRALLTGTENAEFKTTLFAGNTYRIAACSGDSDGNLIFKLVDEMGNLLFSNAEVNNAPYWDFVIDHTITVKVEAMLDQSRSSSGCAVVIIGFKK